MRRTLLLAALVIVPVLVVIGVAVAGSSDPDAEPAAGRSSTTVGGAASAPDGSTSTAPGATATSAPETRETILAEQVPPATEPSAPATTTTEIPSPPGVAGVEGDRPVTTYPQPTVPDGGCPGRDGTVVITLDDRPSPGCVSVGAGQTIEFANRTGGEISLVAESINEVVAPGGSFSVGASAFPEGRSTFWSPGHPTLSGIVELRP